MQIVKSDHEKMLAFGWMSVSMRVDGQLIEDWQNDVIEPEELEASTNGGDYGEDGIYKGLLFMS